MIKSSIFSRFFSVLFISYLIFCCIFVIFFIKSTENFNPVFEFLCVNLSNSEAFTPSSAVPNLELILQQQEMNISSNLDLYKKQLAPLLQLENFEFSNLKGRFDPKIISAFQFLDKLFIVSSTVALLLILYLSFSNFGPFCS